MLVQLVYLLRTINSVCPFANIVEVTVKWISYNDIRFGAYRLFDTLSIIR